MLYEQISRAAEHQTITPATFGLARKLIRDFDTKLASADAQHLASTIEAQANLVSFDQRLVAAAARHGVEATDLSEP